jgi:signal transduction histidine kinase
MTELSARGPSARLLKSLTPLLGLLVFGATLGDTARGFDWLDWRAASGLALLAGLACIALARAQGWRSRPATLSLLATSSLALILRLLSYDLATYRLPERWEQRRRQAAEATAAEVSARFTALTRQAASTAKRLAADRTLIEAAREPNAREKLQPAFDLLAKVSLPRPIRDAEPGVTLYDSWTRPLAWGGKNVDLSYLDLPEEMLAGRVFILSQGVFTHLVALEPLPDRQGAVAVEVPLVAERLVANRYLSDYQLLAEWAEDTPVSVDYLDFREPATELTALFARGRDRYTGGTRERPVFHFPLRAESGALLGVAAITADDVTRRLEEHRRNAQILAGLLLVIFTLPLVLLLGARLWNLYGAAGVSRPQWLPAALAFAGAVWGLRGIVLFLDLPLGFGGSLDNPAYYASQRLLHLLGSPADFLATALATLLSVAALAYGLLATSPIEGAGRWRLGRLLIRSGSAAAALALLALTGFLVRDTAANANLPLSAPGFFPLDPPRLSLQLGLIAFFAATALAVVAVLVLGRRLGDAGAETVSRLLVGWVLLGAIVVIGASLVALPLSPPVLCPLALFFALDGLAGFREPLSRRLRQGGLNFRLLATYLFLLLPVAGYFPALAHYEERTVLDFMQKNVAESVRQQGDSKEYVLREALGAIDRMEAEGRLDTNQPDDLAYQLWAGAGLSTFSLGSSVEAYGEDGVRLSRFALNFPSPAEEDFAPPTLEERWLIEEETYPGEPHRPRVWQARRWLSVGRERIGVAIRLVADWSNLPFIASRNPYIDLFRSPGTEAPLPFARRPVNLHVYDPHGNSRFQSSSEPLVLDADAMRLASGSPVWTTRPIGGRLSHCLLFSDGEFLFALSYPRQSTADFAAALVGWATLTAVAAVGLLLLALGLGRAGWPVAFQVGDLFRALGTSFYNKLFVAFVLVALVPIVFLAVVVRGIMVSRLEYHVEHEGMARAKVVERFLHDYLLADRIQANERGVAAVTDSVLQFVSSLVEADIDLYSRGDLVATSKRELFASGLLPTRAVPAVYREVVLDRADHFIHRESVGRFRYLVVSVPISLERWREPGIVSIPLASRQREIEQEVASLNQLVLLLALCFSLAAAAVSYSLARRIAEPINLLTGATRRISEGDFGVRLSTEARDEIGALFEGFNRMASDLESQRRNLERTNKLEAWAEMARQVAHEVKNPLTPIQLSAEHLRRVFHDPGVDFAAVLKSCTETILRQVRALRQISLEFSTFASPAPPAPEPTDVGRLVRETLNPYAESPPPGVSVAISVAPDLPLLPLDRRLMQRTLVNLMENALAALNGEGEVSVQVARAAPPEAGDRRWVEISVRDSGVGIDPKVRARVFEPYFSSRAEGSGLGLAIARKVVEDHGGTIDLESEAGQGTRVRLWLPAD